MGPVSRITREPDGTGDLPSPARNDSVRLRRASRHGDRGHRKLGRSDSGRGGSHRVTELVLRGGSAMLRTIARMTDVEPGHVRAFEVRDDGAEAVGRSRIPLLKTIGVGRSKETRISSRTWQGRSLPSTTRAPTGAAHWAREARRVHGPGACHGSRFDVASGAVVRGPAEAPVRSYPSTSPMARSRSTCTGRVVGLAKRGPAVHLGSRTHGGRR